MAGTGIFRNDQVEFAIAEESTDGTAPGTVATMPGLIKSGIEVPDVEYEWDPFFGVGRNGRSRKDIHEGPQNFRGSIPQMYIGHETGRLALELSLGEHTDDIVSLAGTNPGEITAVDETTMTDSGEDFESSLAVKDGNYAVFSGISVGYIENETGTASDTITVYPTPARSGTKGWNGPQPAVGDEYEVRKDQSVGTSTGDKFTVQTQRLNTMTWALRHRNSANHGASSVGSNLTVNYLGGKVNRWTLSANEGEKVMLGWDEVLFRDLRHDASLPSTSVSKYSGSVTAPTASHPTEEPLVFSQGTIALFELSNTFARINSFRLTVDNGLEARRYISTATIGGSSTVAQVPYELIEGNRTISLEIEAIMETREYWEHLMRQGQNDALSAKTGFDFFMKFENSAGDEFFYIQGPAHANPVIIADDTLPVNTSNAQASTSNVGCVLNSAPHTVGPEGEPLVRVRLSIDVPSLVMWWTDA